MNHRSKTQTVLMVLLGGIVSLALLPAVIPPGDPDLLSLSQPPSLKHPMGTSPAGIDVFRLSLEAGRRAGLEAVLAAALTLFLGAIIGGTAGIKPRSWFDYLQSVCARVLEATGPLLPTICIAAVAPRLEPASLGVVVSLFAWPPVATVVRGEIIHEGERLYVEAARSIGVSPFRLFVACYFPAMLARLRPWCFGLFSAYVALFGALGFLGVGNGVERTLGFLLFDSLGHLRGEPWYFIGLLVAFLVLLGVAAPFVRSLLSVPSFDSPDFGSSGERVKRVLTE
jgi:peptide/nickel transport system permease protein